MAKLLSELTKEENQKLAHEAMVSTNRFNASQMKKKKIAEKMIKLPKKELLAEHKRIIPELKKHGLTKEANKQTKELKEYKKE
jgi:hypothetical protein